MKLTIILLFISVILYGCGGGGGGAAGGATSSSFGASITSKFVDSPVANLNYTTQSGASGVTDASGNFTCKTGENVTFKVGALTLGTIACGRSTVDLMTLYYGDNWTTVQGPPLRMAIVLMSLDDDADPSNGISIPEGTKSYVQNYDLTSVAVVAFTNYVNTLRTDIAGEVTTTQAAIGSLATAYSDATTHLNNSINKYVGPRSTSEYPLGWSNYAGTTYPMHSQFGSSATYVKYTLVKADGVDVSNSDVEFYANRGIADDNFTKIRNAASGEANSDNMQLLINLYNPSSYLETYRKCKTRISIGASNFFASGSGMTPNSDTCASQFGSSVTTGSQRKVTNWNGLGYTVLEISPDGTYDQTATGYRAFCITNEWTGTANSVSDLNTAMTSKSCL